MSATITIRIRRKTFPCLMDPFTVTTVTRNRRWYSTILEGIRTIHYRSKCWNRTWRGLIAICINREAEGSEEKNHQKRFPLGLCSSHHCSPAWDMSSSCFPVLTLRQNAQSRERATRGCRMSQLRPFPTKEVLSRTRYPPKQLLG